MHQLRLHPRLWTANGKSPSVGWQGWETPCLGPFHTLQSGSGWHSATFNICVAELSSALSVAFADDLEIALVLSLGKALGIWLLLHTLRLGLSLPSRVTVNFVGAVRDSNAWWTLRNRPRLLITVTFRLPLLAARIAGISSALELVNCQCCYWTPRKQTNPKYN